MRRTHVVAVASGAVGVLLGALWLSTRDSGAPAGTGSEPDRVAAERSPASADARRVDPSRLDPSAARESEPLQSGATLVVSLDSLASVETLVVPLRLGQPEPPGAKLTGRILTEGRVLDLSAAVGEDLTDVAEIAVATDFLRPPGRYIVEIKTSEKSHFPLRRYAIEVR